MSVTDRVTHSGLNIDARLFQFVDKQVIPGTQITTEKFWGSFASIVSDLGPKNIELLKKRDDLQEKIDDWYQNNQLLDSSAEQKFLSGIGYIEEPVKDFQVDVNNIDIEISKVAGPQLVVPVDNARYVLNACNARWGSLYDSLYGSDVIPEDNGCKRTKKFNPVRGVKVIQYVRDFLDQSVPLAIGSHSYVVKYQVKSGNLIAEMGDGTTSLLGNRDQFIGYKGSKDKPASVLLRNNHLHIEVCIGEGFYIGKGDLANVFDVKLESAITTIMDCEDSVAAVDAQDKLRCYSNWLGLMKGNLSQTVTKDDQIVERNMEPDRDFISAEDKSKTISLPGRSLLLMRNVGIHMYTDAVTDSEGNEIPEGFLDAMVTILCARHDLLGNGEFRNSQCGSIYIVKPKLHGPQEVEATAELFSSIEEALELEPCTVKIGVMDEERRTTVNLKNCIAKVQNRLFFINTGFMDRTGNEIHTCMQAGAVLPKTRMKSATWLLGYEDWNVDVGLNCGLVGYAQIGKGMWAAPDSMALMMETKAAHPRSGASTAWVPSPTAATLHAIHYHRVNVRFRQTQLAKHVNAQLDDILQVPVVDKSKLTNREIRNELENSAQSIVGYVVRWVNQGVGCSKVPDINDVPLMEDRATLRISSQQLANWLHHQVITPEQVRAVFLDMARTVDWQNHRDPGYTPMCPDIENSVAFKAALDLVFKGKEIADGYTEPVLHAARRAYKKVLSNNLS